MTDEIAQAKKPKTPTKKAVKIQPEPEFINEVKEDTPPTKRGRGRPKKPVRIPNPKYKNTSNSKILLWNKIIKEQGHMKGGSNRMPKKGSPEYLAVRKIYDELVKSLEVLKPLAPGSP